MLKVTNLDLFVLGAGNECDITLTSHLSCRRQIYIEPSMHETAEAVVTTTFSIDVTLTLKERLGYQSKGLLTVNSEVELESATALKTFILSHSL